MEQSIPSRERDHCNPRQFWCVFPPNLPQLLISPSPCNHHSPFDPSFLVLFKLLPHSKTFPYHPRIKQHSMRFTLSELQRSWASQDRTREQFVCGSTFRIREALALSGIRNGLILVRTVLRVCMRLNIPIRPPKIAILECGIPRALLYGHLFAFSSFSANLTIL